MRQSELRRTSWQRTFWAGVLAMVILVLVALPVAAQGGDGAWEMKTDIRIWGFDLIWNRLGAPLRSGVNTNYVCSLGGGLQTFGFYREPDATAYTPPQDGANRALYQSANLTWSFGLKQGLAYDLTRRRNLWEMFLFYHGRYDYLLVDESPEALLFATSLPDRHGGVQNAFCTGLLYNGVDFNRNRWLKQGLHAELSWEFAPLFFFNEGTGADYRRFNLTVLGFLPLVDKEKVSIYVGERFMIDHLSGDYIPVRARTNLGGFSRYPGFTTGLGGGVRGVEAGRFDGYVKALNNLEVRINFPQWSEYEVVPEIIGYVDLGVGDDLTSRLNWDQILTSVGVGVGVSDLIVYGSYFCNDDKFSVEISLGIHF